MPISIFFGSASARADLKSIKCSENTGYDVVYKLTISQANGTIHGGTSTEYYGWDYQGHYNLIRTVDSGFRQLRGVMKPEHIYIEEALDNSPMAWVEWANGSVKDGIRVGLSTYKNCKFNLE